LLNEKYSKRKYIMKIKNIKNIDKIKITVTHLELMVILKALKNSELTLFNLEDFNDINFDKDELKSGSDIREINKEIQLAITKGLKNIDPY